MEKYYYIDGSGQQQGSVDANELTKLGVTKETLVWKEGMDEWKKAGEVEELAGIFRSMPPPIGKKSTPPPVRSKEEMSRLPIRKVSSIVMLSIVTLCFYQVYLIHAFAKETNIACHADGEQTSGLTRYLLLSLVTLNIYGFVWWNKWSHRCNSYLVKNGKSEVVKNKRLYLQNAVNATYNELNNL